MTANLVWGGLNQQVGLSSTEQVIANMSYINVKLLQFKICQI